MAAIAFFDVDKTLLSVNSASLWLRREFKSGNISRLQALKAGFWISLYQLGFARMEDVLTKAVSTARAAVLRHKERGDLVFLLTSSSNYLSAPIADELNLDGFLANRFVVDKGVFTGHAVLPLCFGAGKVSHARVVADKLHVDLRQCTFYTDSASDVPMLEAVGVPVAVDPDPRLRRIARRRGWAIETWRQPLKALPPPGDAH